MKANILIVVDMQKGFNLSSSSELAYEKIESLLSKSIFDLVVFTQYYNYENSSISRLMNWNNLMNENEIALDYRAKYDNQMIVRKNKYSCYSEKLIKDIENRIGEKLDTVFLCGVDLECCVLASAVDFFEDGIRPIVLTHYSGSSSNELYFKNGIYTLHHLIGRNNITGETVECRDDLERIVKHAFDFDVNIDKIPIQEEVVTLLIQKGWTISFAESCTGGLVSGRLVSASSASKAFNSSFVTYSNESKVKILGVDQVLIDRFGAVSEETAAAMAKGCAIVSGSNIGVAVSGIAGPTGGTPTKPVGMVCYGFYINGETYTFTKYYGNPGRNIVREFSVTFVFQKLLAFLKDN